MSATTTVTISSAQIGNGRIPHYIRTDGFHARTLCDRNADRVLSDQEAAKASRHCIPCTRALEEITRAAQEPAEAPAAPAAEEAAAPSTPGDVTRPGVKIRKDGRMKWTVERGGHMGVIFDEEGMKRGRWAAWSPFAHTPHNMAAFTDDAEAAVDAILATFPVRVAALARELGVSVVDVLAEAAALEAEWAELGPRAVLAKVPNGASTALTGAAALTVRESLAARAAEVATRTPGDVIRPGVTIRKKEFGNAWTVQRDEQEGVIFDEGGAAERGGRWVASSPFATTWRNLVSTTDNPEEAVDAILDTLPALASTVAGLTGTTTSDVLEEAANLAAEWKDRGAPCSPRRCSTETPSSTARPSWRS